MIAFDRTQAELVELSAADCRFSYRMSRFKADDAGRFIVCGVSFRLAHATPTVSYPDLIAELERRAVSSPFPIDVRDAVLTIRRRKGMVLDASDPDTRSVGSFFMNPVVTLDDRERDRVDRPAMRSLALRMADGRVKIPAAWLIERSGVRKGHGERTVGLSTKHPLAIVNRGGATATRCDRGLRSASNARCSTRCGVLAAAGAGVCRIRMTNEDVEFLQKARG